MKNYHRGDVTLTLQKKRFPLRLTLASLAELEAEFQNLDFDDADQSGLPKKVSVQDFIRLLGIAVRGGGNDLSDEEISQKIQACDLDECVKKVAELLTLTFGENT